jgi:HlyD family secretion protein
MWETLCALRVVAALVSACPQAGSVAVGYIEGEYVQLAPLDIAQILEVRVRRGDRVKAGDVVAVTEQSDMEITIRDGEARLAGARSDLENLKRGRRPEEIAVIEATLASAEASARDAARALTRRQDLFNRGFAPQADLDQALTARDVADARVKELGANLAVAKLPAREDEIKAAETRVQQAMANLDQLRWRLGRRTVAALAEGRIFDVIRRAGELGGPTAPIVSMLPDGAIKVKIYVPQRLLSSVQLGGTLNVRCDGCRAGLTARVSYIAPEPEFTPPVIYSLETRQKLVFLIEARPEGNSLDNLQPGQIVDVVFPATANEGRSP